MFNITKKIFIISIITTIIMGNSFMNVEAEVKSNNDIQIIQEEDGVLIYTDKSNEKESQRLLEEYLNNPNVKHVSIIDRNEVIETPTTNQMQNSRAFGYTVGGVTCAIPHISTLGTVIAVAGGEGGGKITMEGTREVKNSYSATYGASVSSISAAVGYNVAQSTKFSIKYEYTVPKKVKHMKIYAKPIVQTDYYNVYLYGRKKGKGTAKKVVGIDHIKVIE